MNTNTATKNYFKRTKRIDWAMVAVYTVICLAMATFAVCVCASCVLMLNSH